MVASCRCSVVHRHVHTQRAEAAWHCHRRWLVVLTMRTMAVRSGPAMTGCLASTAAVPKNVVVARFETYLRLVHPTDPRR